MANARQSRTARDKSGKDKIGEMRNWEPITYCHICLLVYDDCKSHERPIRMAPRA